MNNFQSGGNSEVKEALDKAIKRIKNKMTKGQLSICQTQLEIDTKILILKAGMNIDKNIRMSKLKSIQKQKQQIQQQLRLINLQIKSLQPKKNILNSQTLSQLKTERLERNKRKKLMKKHNQQEISLDLYNQEQKNRELRQKKKQKHQQEQLKAFQRKQKQIQAQWNLNTKHPKPKYKILHQQYNLNFVLPQQQRRKQILKKIKQEHSPIDYEELRQHSNYYLESLKEKRNSSYTLKPFSSANKEKSQNLIRSRQKLYSQLVKEIFPPKVFKKNKTPQPIYRKKCVVKIPKKLVSKKSEVPVKITEPPLKEKQDYLSRRRRVRSEINPQHIRYKSPSRQEGIARQYFRGPEWIKGVQIDEDISVSLISEIKSKLPALING